MCTVILHVSLLSVKRYRWTGVKAPSLITSRSSSVHSCTLSFFLPPSLHLSFPRVLPPPECTVKNLNSAHIAGWILYIVPNFLTPPSDTHINPFSFPLFFFFFSSSPFFAICPSLPHLFSQTPPVIFLSSAHPSLPSFLPCVCPALGRCERGPGGWHGSLARAHKTPH